MTFIAVNILKIEEDSVKVRYEFGDPPKKVLGIVEILKSDGEVNVTEITNEKYLRTIVPYVKKLLAEHYQKGEFPERSSWQS